MKLKQSDTQQAWLQFTDGRQIQLHKDAVIEITDSGLLFITYSKVSGVICFNKSFNIFYYSLIIFI